jgi:hypothetical protein
MSRNLQLDLHPDAESLNAFAERALAGQEHERVAAHIAVCGRCREIVFLAQDVSEEMEPALVAAATPAQPVVVRAPRFKAWRLAWIPFVALAAGIIIGYVLHIHHAEESATQMAQSVNEAVSPQASPQNEPGLNAAKETTQVTARKGREAPTSDAVTPISNSPVALAASQARVTVPSASPTSGVGFVEQKPQVQAEISKNAKAFEAKKAAPAAADKPQPVEAQVIAAAAPMSEVEVTAAPPPAPPSGGAVHGVLTPRALYKLRTPELPSGLAPVSTVTEEHEMLAVDTEGGVFLSNDAGVHWESIGRQWNGRAVAVRFAEGLNRKIDTNSGAGMPQTRFELVNDVGQVWISMDGRVWKASGK